jgi:hypothetical protein
VDWTLAPDEEKPKLDVVWTPSKGTPVRVGDRITVHVTARDDATAAQTTPAQTGVARIRVDVGIGGGLVAAPAEYPPPMPLQECGRQNPVRIYEATYTVPADAPPVVKLRAYARDFAGNETWEDADFPLQADWYGTFTYPAGQPPHQTTTRADLVLNHDGKGNLTGTMVGETRLVDASTAPGCFSSTVRPHNFRVALTGAYTEGRSIKVFIGDIQETPMIVNNRCPTYNTNVEANQLGFKNYIGLGWYAQQPFLGTPSPLGEGEVFPDGTRVYRHSNVTGTMTVTLRRARN